ncbi:MAG TPA: ABC transporter permease [Syntrophales bacterium]|nr:ABC transporter permease [Syntrophales bacterium]
MLNYLVKRTIHAVFVILAVLVFVFFIVHLTGDPAELALGTDTSAEEVARFRTEMGFDRPLYVQFADFLRGILFKGDFGISLRYNEPALPIVLERIPATIELTAAAMSIALIVGIPCGLISALMRKKLIDIILRILALLGQSAPIFWVGIMLVLVFAVKLQIFPSSGRDDGWLSIVLPAITLSHYSAASIIRLLRSSVLDTLTQDYVRTARAKGIPERIVIVQHIFRNSMLPVVTLVGLQFGTLLGGAVVTETIFAWPGVGRLIVQAIYNRDIFLIQASVFVIALMFVVLNFLIDVIYTFLDPRIRINR